MARDLVRRWWGLDLGLTEADGTGYVRRSHATCDTVSGAAGAKCELAMREIAAGFAGSGSSKQANVTICHAGLVIVAAPVFGSNGLAGLVYASGGCAATLEVEHQLVATIGCAPAEAVTLATVVPALS